MILYGQDKLVSSWVCNKLKIKPYDEGLYVAVGIVENGQFIGGVVWNNYHTDQFGKPLSIEVSIATIDKRWATRHNLRELFGYPFIQLGVKRVQATCHRKSKRVRTTLKKLRFTFEGIARSAHTSGDDAACYSILKDECIWIRNQTSGQKRTISSSSTRPSSNGRCTNTEQPANCAL